MKIKEIEISCINEYENNPRNNEKAVEAVAESIKQFGFKVPIVVDKYNVVVCGHTRLKAAKKLGLAEVPCVYADDLTEQQIKAYRIADNKVSELASWDNITLAQELEEITDLDMQEFGVMPDIGEDIDVDKFFTPDASGEDSKKKKTITCPHCGEEIEI